MKSLLSAVVCFLAMTTSCVAQVFDEKFEHWPLDLKINGRVIVAGELEDMSTLAKLLRESDRKKKTAIALASVTDDLRNAFRELFTDNDKLSFIEAPVTSERIRVLLSSHDVVVWHSPDALNESIANEVRKAKPAFFKFLNEGRMLITLGGAAETVAHSYFEVEDARPTVFKGLDLLPDCVLKTNFEGTAGKIRLLEVLAAQPRSVGIGLDRNTALILSGRKIRVSGPGEATFLLKGNEREPPRIHSIVEFTPRVRDPEKVLVDLTQWRRDAIDRTLPQFPPKKPRKPFVSNGTLIIIGGGGTPRGLMSQMIELAGGVDKAKLVYVPCAEREDIGDQQRMVQIWKRSGVKHASFIHTKDRIKANTDHEFLEPLKDATGIFFGGGRQWNFADSYYGTQAHKLMKDVLDRGGVIAGSSAGASIQGRYLARATPINNVRIMAFGYERGGLGFLDSVAIDQHFSQRRRQKDMTALVNRYPQLLGIGIDETTAIIVQKSKAKVVGRGKVYFYDRNVPLTPGTPDHTALPDGSEYDLVTRTVLKDTTETPPEDE